MAEQSTQSITVDAPAAEVMAVIADFPAYPQWVSAAKTVEVLETGEDGRARQVHFVIDAGRSRTTTSSTTPGTATGRSPGPSSAAR